MAARWDCLEELEFMTTWRDHVSGNGMSVTKVASPER